MPLSPPAARKPIHTRQITCCGYQREDGLWDVDGHFLDIKSHDYRTADDDIVPAGEPIHQMRMRITVDPGLTIVAVEAVTENAPSRSCGEIPATYRQLEGLRIGPGFSRKVKELFAGIRGCTHLSDLIAPMANTVLQTLSQRYNRAEQQRIAELNGTKPALVDSCHTFRSDGPVVLRLWPKSYTGAAGDVPASK